ncbi:RNA-binding protein 25-like isoform X1 [Polyodon spathula]|uniref:RNA-binding protein 25-like isoform X1 n=2 Tax=Polyodon spathula TaxID=7913 RepID=UPI001B7EF273|nr:RNA-binding protein 25-like isoform X1 [Polyodon spathula]
MEPETASLLFRLRSGQIQAGAVQKMSFPPHMNRPQIGIPPLPPGIPPPQFAGFPQTVPPGTPMIPVHMGIMTSAPTVLVPTMPMVGKPMGPRKDFPGMRNKENDDSGGPTTTVFVGNISEKASDMLIRQLLAKCGLVLSWKRVQGASGKLQGKNRTAFGFCEYKEPESTLRSLRLLHELQIGDKKLLVKVDAKTKAQLDEWKAKKRSANGSTKPDSSVDEVEEELDDETKRRDQIVKGAIEGLIREYSSELNAPSQEADTHHRKKKKEKKEDEDINAIDMEEDKRDLISREISKFRDTHKKLEEEKGKKEKERQEIEKERREREKERERERERRDREREREREREKEKEERERERDRERTKDKEREREREREKERSRDRSKDRSRSREKSRDKDKKRDREEDEEEAYERRKLERKLRDKETAYQERLKNWEIRERKKAREYAKEAEREEERRRETAKEAKRLKEFLEDYDDDRDDPKYYRGSALQKRLRDREKEMEADERDRKREKEELEEIRQRLLAEGHPDPDAELQRMEQEAERRRQPPVKQEPESEEEVEEEKPPQKEERREVELEPESEDDVEEGEELEEEEEEQEDLQEPKPCLKPTLRPITSAPSVSSGSGGATPNTPGDESPCGIIIPHENSPETHPQEELRPKIGLSLKLGPSNSPSQPSVGKRKKLVVDSVFNKFDNEESDEVPRKRKLVPLDYEEDEKGGGKGNVNTEEKRKHIKSLIEKIPTAKPELFLYPLDWSIVDTTLMERRIRPWINKKIIEYIGEEEATLVDFVCSKVMAHGTPQGILDDVAMVLDEEAEVFIVKMWRLLIYETEAKKIGLVK